jgi:hypothetical protein
LKRKSGFNLSVFIILVLHFLRARSSVPPSAIIIAISKMEDYTTAS